MAQTYNDAVPASTRNALEDLTAIRNNFAALKSCFSGATAPPNPVAGMWWYDTTANMLKIRNEANDARLNVYDFANGRAPLALLATNCSRTVVAGTGVSVAGNLASGNVTVAIASGGVGNTQVANAALGAEKFKSGTTERDWVLARIAGATAGGVGSYALLYSTNDYNMGDETAGSNLRYPSIGIDGNGFLRYATAGTPTGTWRCMGIGTSTYTGSITLWLRIS